MDLAQIGRRARREVAVATGGQPDVGAGDVDTVATGRRAGLSCEMIVLIGGYDEQKNVARDSPARPTGKEIFEHPGVRGELLHLARLSWPEAAGPGLTGVGLRGVH